MALDMTKLRVPPGSLLIDIVLSVVVLYGAGQASERLATVVVDNPDHRRRHPEGSRQLFQDGRDPGRHRTRLFRRGPTSHAPHKRNHLLDQGGGRKLYQRASLARQDATGFLPQEILSFGGGHTLWYLRI